MMDFNERVIPGVSSNFMYKEAIARYFFASKFIKPGMKVLDLGCGTGYGAKILAQNGAKVLAIDRDKEALAFASKHFKDKNIKFIKGNVILSHGKNYNVVVSFEVIEHLKNPSVFLLNIKRSLVPGGVFIVSTPNAKISSPNGGVASSYHEKEYRYSEFSEMLKQKFDKVEIFGQTKSRMAKKSWQDFLKSQNVREGIVNRDLFGIRKLIPKSAKEKVWKYFGNFVGRRAQEVLDERDFPISKKIVSMSDYFIAVCQKSQ